MFCENNTLVYIEVTSEIREEQESTRASKFVISSVCESVSTHLHLIIIIHSDASIARIRKIISPLTRLSLKQGTGDGQRANSNGQRANSNGQRATGNGQRGMGNL